MFQVICQVFDCGGVVVGFSVGVVIMSCMMFCDVQDNLQILKGQWCEYCEYDCGFGFVGFDLFIDQYFLRCGCIG